VVERASKVGMKFSVVAPRGSTHLESVAMMVSRKFNWNLSITPPAGPFNHLIAMRTNWCRDEAFRDGDRAPATMEFSGLDVEDWPSPG
jgi:hypothetical protein